jgi:hypothetical protein
LEGYIYVSKILVLGLKTYFYPACYARQKISGQQAAIKVWLKIGEVLFTKLRSALGSCF